MVIDIESGFNFKRKGFLFMVDSVIKANIAQIVVMYRDRLSIWGLNSWNISSEKLTRNSWFTTKKGPMLTEPSVDELHLRLLSYDLLFLANCFTTWRSFKAKNTPCHWDQCVGSYRTSWFISHWSLEVSWLHHLSHWYTPMYLFNYPMKLVDYQSQHMKLLWTSCLLSSMIRCTYLNYWCKKLSVCFHCFRHRRVCISSFE